MEKKIINNTILALLYFKELGEDYSDKAEGARVRFLYLLKEDKLDKAAFDKAKAKYLALQKAEFDKMTPKIKKKPK
jgi:hypothetical protein